MPSRYHAWERERSGVLCKFNWMCWPTVCWLYHWAHPTKRCCHQHGSRISRMLWLQRRLPEQGKVSVLAINHPGEQLNLREWLCVRIIVIIYWLLKATATGPGGKINSKVGYKHRRLSKVVKTGIYECNDLCKCKERKHAWTELRNGLYNCAYRLVDDKAGIGIHNLL